MAMRPILGMPAYLYYLALYCESPWDINPYGTPKRPLPIDDEEAASSMLEAGGIQFVDAK